MEGRELDIVLREPRHDESLHYPVLRRLLSFCRFVDTTPGLRSVEGRGSDKR